MTGDNVPTTTKNPFRGGAGGWHTQVFFRQAAQSWKGHLMVFPPLERIGITINAGCRKVAGELIFNSLPCCDSGGAGRCGLLEEAVQGFPLLGRWLIKLRLRRARHCRQLMKCRPDHRVNLLPLGLLSISALQASRWRCNWP